jgi:predicted 3-demethylubiquinone-9 3-methyltransferase (glyoxalase superfamily)
MNTITPFLWFDNQAKEAMDFYCGIFKESKVISAHPMPDGNFMSVEFELNGQRFMGLNAGPQFKFNESVSFFVACDGQEEVDYFWNALIAGGGSEGNCGWLKDQFGLSWQIVPKQLGEFLGNSDREGANRAMQAMMGMHKIEVQELQNAFDGQ